jgi:hypothetical protein
MAAMLRQTPEEEDVMALSNITRLDKDDPRSIIKLINLLRLADTINVKSFRPDKVVKGEPDQKRVDALKLATRLGALQQLHSEVVAPQAEDLEAAQSALRVHSSPGNIETIHNRAVANKLIDRFNQLVADDGGVPLFMLLRNAAASSITKLDEKGSKSKTLNAILESPFHLEVLSSLDEPNRSKAHTYAQKKNMYPDPNALRLVSGSALREITQDQRGIQEVLTLPLSQVLTDPARLRQLLGLLQGADFKQLASITETIKTKKVTAKFLLFFIGELRRQDINFREVEHMARQYAVDLDPANPFRNEKSTRFSIVTFIASHPNNSFMDVFLAAINEGVEKQQDRKKYAAETQQGRKPERASTAPGSLFGLSEQKFRKSSSDVLKAILTAAPDLTNMIEHILKARDPASHIIARARIYAGLSAPAEEGAKYTATSPRGTK